MIYGLTGSIASGKTTAANYFIEKGELVIDSDKIAREVSEREDIIDRIRMEFGTEFIEGGKLNRRKLRELVFNSKAETDKLNKIMHVEILNEVRKQIEKNKGRSILIVDMPLLFEVGFDSEVEKTIVVYSDEDIIIERVVKRDKTTAENAYKLLNSQMSSIKKREKADIIIENNGSIEELTEKLEKLYLEMKKVCVK